mgnify:CR=1 FL=1
MKFYNKTYQYILNNINSIKNVKIINNEYINSSKIIHTFRKKKNSFTIHEISNILYYSLNNIFKFKINNNKLLIINIKTNKTITINNFHYILSNDLINYFNKILDKSIYNYIEENINNDIFTFCVINNNYQKIIISSRNNTKLEIYNTFKFKDKGYIFCYTTKYKKYIINMANFPFSKFNNINIIQGIQDFENSYLIMNKFINKLNEILESKNKYNMLIYNIKNILNYKKK